jgi:hypothetical protein
MATIEIKAKVIKWRIGKTERDERDENESGLTSEYQFKVAGSPKNGARMMKLMRSGFEVELIVRCTEAISDVEVTDIDLTHQMSFGERPVNDMTANAAFPPIPDNPEPGATAIRTGEPIVTEAEANAEFDAMPSGNTKGKPDLNGLKIKQPKEGQTEFTVSLNGTREKGELIPTILKVFCAKDSKELTDTLLSYEQSKNRDLLLEILQINQMPESVR